MKKALLVINAGSSSLKFSVFFVLEKSLQLVSKGQIEGIGVAPTFVVKNELNKVLFDHAWTHEPAINHEFLLKYLINWLNESFLNGVPLLAAGHRVVHGGSKYSQPLIVDDTILTALEKLIPLAPLHQPHNLAAIQILKNNFPSLPQVACFDTAFHTTNPEIFQHFFIPRELEKEGVRRYGFHGLSYEFIQHSLKKNYPELADKKIIVAHLGSGASMCAMENGKSQTTSMGLTALDGLPMGTRPGTLDAGVILYLLDEKKMTSKQIENLLYKKSGLLGLSEISNDMRVLEESNDPRAEMTLEAYAWRIAQMTGQLAASLQGIDAFVFTAGIGENSDLLRQRVCSKLAWLGIELSASDNSECRRKMTEAGLKISSAKSRIPVLVIPTNEELMIAQHCLEVM